MDAQKLAKAALRMMKLREESYVPPTSPLSAGRYSLDMEQAAIAALVEEGLDSRLYQLLNLAAHWWNDLGDWAKDVAVGGKQYLWTPCSNCSKPVPEYTRDSKGLCTECQT